MAPALLFAVLFSNALSLTVTVPPRFRTAASFCACALATMTFDSATVPAVIRKPAPSELVASTFVTKMFENETVPPDTWNARTNFCPSMVMAPAEPSIDMSLSIVGSAVPRKIVPDTLKTIASGPADTPGGHPPVAVSVSADVIASRRVQTDDPLVSASELTVMVVPVAAYAGTAKAPMSVPTSSGTRTTDRLDRLSVHASSRIEPPPTNGAVCALTLG